MVAGAACEREELGDPPTWSCDSCINYINTHPELKARVSC